MKKILCFTIAFICVISLCACSQPTEVGDVKMWDCTIISPEETSENSYVISYTNEKIVSTTGTLTLENRNNFDIVVHLVANGKERVEEIGVGEVTILHQIGKDSEYTLGCHAEVPEGTEMKLFVYDGEGNIMHLGEEGEVKSFTPTSGWPTEKIETLFLDHAKSN